MTTDTGFYSIIDYAVDGPQSQAELIEAFVDLQERWVRFYPGYHSARLFAGVEGTRVYNVVRWTSESAYQEFVATSDAKGRIAAIESAVRSVSGWAEPRMSGAPQFRLVRHVVPGPPPAQDGRGPVTPIPGGEA